MAICNPYIELAQGEGKAADVLRIARAWLTMAESEFYVWHPPGRPGEWSIVIDERPVSRLGQCRYRKMEIGLSRFLIDNFSDFEILQTVIHEIAHACCDPHIGHGLAWKGMCRILGYEGYPERTVVVPNVGQYKWETVCTGCGKVTSKNVRKRPAMSLARRTCRHCHNRVTQREISNAD
jgi:predicted SprT family Zn-dependent metalloprotease